MRFCRVTAAVGCFCLLQLGCWGAPNDAVMAEALALRDQGEFEKATRVLQTWVDQNTSDAEAADLRAVEFEVERIRRIRQDYRLTRETLLKQMEDRLTTFTETELDTFEREGKLDVQMIDGRKLYVNSSASNLLFRMPELRSRLKKPAKDSAYVRLYEQMLTAKKASEITSLSLVTPQDFLVTYTLVVNPNAAPAGQTIRAWLPFVNHLPSQSDVAILNSNPAPAAIAPPEYPHRSIYMEQPAVADQPATFSLSFVYRSWSRTNDLDPADVREYDKRGPEYAFYTAERKPHIDFSSEELNRIKNEVSVGDPNPLLQARRIYDWIARNTIYQYAREYSTLDNISQYTAARRAGDCGQHAMLFIALCRMTGIPARWSTGWESFNHRGQNMHDWCEFYVKPWGWLPADPDMAVNVLNYANDELTTSQQEELAGWLFGNMDHYRLTVNTDYGRTLYPEKTDFRSETVDFQRGEVEAGGKNLYFDQWDYTMRIRPIAATEAEAIRRKSIPPHQKLPKPTPTPTPAATPVPSPPPATVTSGTVETTSTTAVAVETSGPKVTPTPAATENSTSASVEQTAPVATPVATPTPTPVPSPTAAPDVTPAPAATPAATPEATPIPTPEPSPAPVPATTPAADAPPAQKTAPVTDDAATSAPKDTAETTASATAAP